MALGLCCGAYTPVVQLKVLRTQNLLGLSILGALENCLFDLAVRGPYKCKQQFDGLGSGS